eukprot:scaffold2111_cov130-Isochrysis_galbana.AAC.8
MCGRDVARRARLPRPPPPRPTRVEHTSRTRCGRLRHPSSSNRSGARPKVELEQRAVVADGPGRSPHQVASD